MKEPLLILVALFIIIGFTYSPLKKANLNNPSSGTSSSIGADTGNLGSSSNKEVAEAVKEAQQQTERLAEDVNKEIAKSKRSPYYGKVSLSGIVGLYSNDPDREYITIYAELEKNETLNITGWYLKSEVTGYFAMIPKAALLPFPFTKTENDIVLGQRDRVYLTKGFSPIGISFRTNKCTGYFEENRTFTPSLPTICPEADKENLPTFSSVYDRNDECIDIIERISSCTTVGHSFVRDLPDTVTSSCKNYLLEQINYNTCVARHFSDTDFPGNEYRVFLNKFGPLWRTSHDRINLYDENNLIVASITY